MLQRYSAILLAAGLVWATCATSAVAEQAPAAPATAVRGEASTQRASTQRALEQIRSYGIASFRNAGMPASQWSDSTQQLIVEMLERCPRRVLASDLPQCQARSRKELDRSVWRIVKRWQRRRCPRSLDANPALQQRAIDDRRRRDWTLDELAELPEAKLTARQRRILRLLCQGYSHEDIAAELDIEAPTVSHEKYRAVQKLRRAWQANNV
ncbi:LuxR C-terminal-related transcriptional regulator [Roseimaritima sediminicola]|uniref:LuxR C-terminal-related transcriptional regulator n=1 Tax=Roseimaritima sediminicola TaxID=2662066 RepID=UPI001298243A|nr:LuxR C-terminal-related transcriptional regulator [Roseimaritima sediminicola]